MGFFEGIEKGRSKPAEDGFAGKKICISIYHKGQFVDKKLFPAVSIRVGRASNMTLPIYDPSISKFHLSILAENGHFIAQDGGSTNGTTLNGQPMTRSRLKGGDRLKIGLTELMIEFPAAGGSPITEAWVPEEDTNVSEIKELENRARDPRVAADQDFSEEMATGEYRRQPPPLANEAGTDPRPTPPKAKPAEPAAKAAEKPELDEDDEEAENFVPPYSLRDKLFDKKRRNAPQASSPAILEIVQFCGEFVQDVHQLQRRGKLKIKTLEAGFTEARPRIKKMVLAGLTRSGQAEIYFRPDFSGRIHTSNGPVELSQLMQPQYLKSQRSGLYAYPLGRSESAEISTDGTSYFVHFQKLPRVPKEELQLLPSPRLFKPLGSSAAFHLVMLLTLGILHHFFGTNLDELYSRKNLERFVKVDMSQIEATPTPAPVATPAPTPAAKKAKAKKVAKKKTPRKKVARKKTRPKKRSRKLVRKPRRVKGGGKGPVNVSKMGALGSLGTISTGTGKKRAKIMAAVSNLHAVKTDNGSQAFSSSGLMGKVPGGDVKLVRVATVNTKGLGGGNKNFGLAGGVGGKVGGKGVGGLVSIDEETTQEMMVSGSLSVEEVQRVIMRHLKDIRYCYEKQLMRNPSLQGKSKIAWSIKPSGRVSVARVASSSLRSNAVHQCMIRNIKTWKFPKPRGGGDVDVTFPFVFNPVGF